MTDDVGVVQGDQRPEWTFEPGASKAEHAATDRVRHAGIVVSLGLGALRNEISGWQRLTNHCLGIGRR